MPPGSSHNLEDDDDSFEPSDDFIESQSDLDDPTQPCPQCGESVYHDAERCPSCGQDLSDHLTPSRKPWWVILGALVCLYVVLRGLLI